MPSSRSDDVGSRPMYAAEGRSICRRLEFTTVYIDGYSLLFCVYVHTISHTRLFFTVFAPSQLGIEIFISILILFTEDFIHLAC